MINFNMIDTEIILQSVEKHQKVKNLTVLILQILK